MNNYIKFRNKVLNITPLPIKRLLKLILVRWLKLGRVFFPDREYYQGWTTQMKVVSSLLLIGMLSILYYLLKSSFDLAGVALNIGTELVGAVITYILIQNVIGNSEKKEQLIVNLRSKVRDVVLQALEELRRSNWLMDGSLRNANLNGVNLEGAELYNANLTQANLNGAHLSGAKLDSARLSGADLSRANLSRATLVNADLSDTYLYKTVLYGTDLSMVRNLNSAKLNGAWYNDKTNWPVGFDPEAAGAILVSSDGKPSYSKK